MRHGEWTESQWGSLEQFMQRDRLEPCRDCTHRQEDHDDETSACLLCNCTFFEYEGSDF